MHKINQICGPWCLQADRFVLNFNINYHKNAVFMARYECADVKHSARDCLETRENWKTQKQVLWSITNQILCKFTVRL